MMGEVCNRSNLEVWTRKRSRMAGCMRSCCCRCTQAPGRWRLHSVLATSMHVGRGRSKLLACIHGASLDCSTTKRTTADEMLVIMPHSSWQDDIHIFLLIKKYIHIFPCLFFFGNIAGR
uniref:Uncharacterized protein n=1 Tax=Oryza punctata TaxID=4537 RepID=A0A0E0KJJ3_ORYPU